MASRSFAQISCTLPSSKKMRKLNSHKSKWAYMCAHLSPLGNYMGMFRYPVAIWADDACVSVPELLEIVAELTEIDLLEYDEDEQMVRIVAWFHKKNAPENASRMISLAGDYYVIDHECPDMFARSMAEFVIGSVRRAQGWKPDSPDWPKLRECFGSFLRQSYQDFGNQFLHALATEVMASGKAVRAEIGSLFPLIEEAIAGFNETPCPHPEDTLAPQEEETRRDLEDTKKRKEEKKTAHFLANSRADDAEHQDAASEMLGTGTQSQSSSSNVMPLPSTQQSELAREARRASNAR